MVVYTIQQCACSKYMDMFATIQEYKRNHIFPCCFSALSVSIWRGWCGEFKGFVQEAGGSTVPLLDHRDIGKTRLLSELKSAEY